MITLRNQIMKVNKKTILYGVYIFPLLPILLSDSTSYYNALTIIKIIFGFWGFIIAIGTMDVMKEERGLWFLFCFTLFIPYIIHRRVSLDNLVLRIYPIGYFFGLCSFCRKEYKRVVDVLYFWGQFIGVLYVLIIILQVLQGNLGNPILFNNRNAAQTYMTFVIYAILLHNENCNYHNTTIKDVILIVISFTGIFVSGSATGALAACIGIFAIFSYRLISLFKIVMSYLVVFAIIVLIHATNIPIVHMILTIFGKSTTFTNRYWRWMFSLQNIKENVLFGDCELESKASSYINYNVEYFNPHNVLLYLLTFGGILCVIFFGIILWKMRSCKSRSFLVAVSMVAVTGLMESNVAPTSTFFIILTVMTLYFVNYGRKIIK